MANLYRALVVLSALLALVISVKAKADYEYLIIGSEKEHEVCMHIEIDGVPKLDDSQVDISDQVKQLYLSGVVNRAYKVPEEKASRLTRFAHELTKEHTGFPRTRDILAIAFIESSLNPKAKSRWAEGLMGINYKAHKISEPKSARHNPYLNMRHGVRILREYYLELKSAEKAIMAYNVGISAFKRGKLNERYLSKYRKEVSKFNN